MSNINAVATTANNVIQLGVEAKPKAVLPPAQKQRFKIIDFKNNGGTKSFRVIGTNRQGKQIRENFADLKAAQCRQVELMADFLGRQGEDTSLRATTLSPERLRIAEACFVRLDADDDMYLAVDHWLKHGKANAVLESPRLDKAVEEFNEWLSGQDCTLRKRTKGNLRLRVGIFGNSVPNLRVSDVTPDHIDDFLGKLKCSPVTRDNYRRVVSRFFSWCVQRPRRWTATNPCREIRVEKGERPPPAILTVAESQSLLQAAGAFGLAPYVSVCLFAGLRPTEASRLTWEAVNLKDREIRLEGNQTKTGRGRVVTICNTLHAWLTAHKDESFSPLNLGEKFQAAREAAGIKTWIPDVMRHTAISHYFRKTGSYGQTAEQFGNSESIIKAHYQGRVSSDDTKKFYALRPKKG
ncbi:MAG TPA: hypothetical protein VFE51_11665 [Verrucomicrobiae bacterium]|nr:hypothetical protein [Verrucomicrobiae bacterium]